MSATLPRRKWLKETSLAALGLGLAFRSIANEEGITRNFGSELGLINLGSNENPYGFSPKAKQALLDVLGQAHRYQFNVTAVQDFRKRLAEKYGLATDNILVTAGSGEGLGLLARCYADGNLVAANPTFGILPNTAKRIGTEVIEVPLTYEKVHDLPAMLAAINPKTKLVYVCNPANPTGTIVKPAALKSFCEEASKKAVVLIDEAYFDFMEPADRESMLPMIQSNPNIIVMRTFSKIHGMAGLRIGFIAAHPTLIKKLEQQYFSSTQYCMSVLSMNAALASLDDKQHQIMSKEKNDAARKFTLNELTKLNYRAIPSSTNFLFFDLKNYAGDFVQDMQKKNILLRANSYSDGKWCRVSIGTTEEMQKFIKEMKLIS